MNDRRVQGSRVRASMREAAWAAVVGLAGWLMPPAVHAGRPCEPQTLEVADIERGMALAQRTAQALDASGADVVLLARAGQDLGRYGLRWSHVGWAYRAVPPTGGPAVWRVVHKLNHCGTAQAQLYRQGLGEFFMDRPFRYEAAFVVPEVSAQTRLLPVLQDNARSQRWHASAYNMVSYPWSTRYQQSNQWAIETLAGAVDEGASDRPRAQAWLQLRDYQPGVLRLHAITRLGARLTAANVAFDDHPNAKRFADRIETVTADSVFNWLQRSGLSGAMQVVR